MTGDDLSALFGPLSNVATVMIDKISVAIGGLAKPWQIRRVAEAEADARLILAKADAQIDELGLRAVDRLLREERLHQSNMEAVIRTAVPLLLPTAAPQNMDNDWITNFFAKCRPVSDEEMQSLWASILAGEVNQPGSFSKRTVAVMAELDKLEAKQFERVCSVVATLSTEAEGYEPFRAPVVYGSADFYEKLELYSSTYSDLDTVGLLDFASIGFHIRGEHDSVVFEHNGQKLLVAARIGNISLPLGKVSLTRAGRELAPICHATPADGLLDHLAEAWTQEGFQILR